VELVKIPNKEQVTENLKYELHYCSVMIHHLLKFWNRGRIFVT